MGIGITSFLEDCRSRGLTKHTIDTYRSNVSTYLDFVEDPLNVDTPQLRNFLDYLRDDMVYTVGKTRKKGVSPRTLSAYFSAISSYYDYLIYENILNKNPIPPFRRRYLANNRPKTNGENTRQLISTDEMAKLIRQAENILHMALMLVLAKTGIRKGELLAMDLADLDLDKGTIIIKPKAKRTNRLSFIDEETVTVLKEYLVWRKPLARCEALWVKPTGRRMDKDDPYDIVTTYAMKQGLHDPNGPLNRKLTPHCFRHWFTTHLNRAGMSKEYIQELRGDSHQDAFDIYNHIDPSDLRQEYMGCIPALGIQTAPYQDKATMATGGATMATLDQPLRGLNSDIYSLVNDIPGLRPSEIAKHFNKKPNYIRSYLARLEKQGILFKDELSRCFIGIQLLENQPDQSKATMATEGATMATTVQALSGLYQNIYSLISDTSGLKPAEIAKHFNKKPNYIRSYLHRLEKQGLIYKDNYSRCFINSPLPRIYPEHGPALTEALLVEA